MNEKPCWMFKEYASDDTQRDSVSGEFFKSTRLDAVIREAIQNSLDAKNKNANGPAKVRIYYSGSDAAVDAAEYDSLYRGENIDPHYANEDSGVREMLPVAGEKCVFLTIEDFNTTGLTGSVTIRPTDVELKDDRIKGNYYNYFFRENRSDKVGAGALGSWGAGKIMFMKASRLRTAFTLSVRDDAEVSRFLAGRSVMKSHSIGDVTYAPDFWYGIEGTPSSVSRYLRKQPITDPLIIDGFETRFHLIRQANEMGTSIVIPYLNVENKDGDGEFTTSNIARAVIRNFMMAIIRGELEVTVETGTKGEKIEITKSTIAAEKKHLPVKPADGLVTRSHYDLASATLVDGFDEKRTFALKHVGPGTRPCWNAGIFDGVDLKGVKKLLDEGKQIRFEVPMSVIGKTKDNKTVNGKSMFLVSICKAADDNAYRTAYYRVGLLIDSASNRTQSGYVSVVSVNDGDLAKLLVASEPPSHNEWDGNSDRVRESYRYPSEHISFVTSAVRTIIQNIEVSDKEPDADVLIGSFGIPNDTPKPPPPAKPKTCPVCGQDPCVCEKPTPPESPTPPSLIPEEILHFSKLQSKTGFSISVNPKGSPKGYPFTTTYKMGYAPFTKSSWSKFDFALDDASMITVALEDPAQNDIVDIKAEENRLTLTVKKPGAFRISVTGFDGNRDLEVSKGHYDYSQVVTEEA